MTVVRTTGALRDDPGRTADVTLVPYQAWANREVGPMLVWLPRT